MLIRVLMIFLSICTLTCSAEARVWDRVKSIFSQKDPIPAIKVLVVENEDGIILEVKGKYNIFDPYTGSRLGTRFVGKGHLIQSMAGGLKWGEEFPGVYQIQITPDDPRITTVVDGIEYRGSIYIYDIKGRISVVNEVPLEDYINSVLALEFKEPLSPEAMASIAIIERTKAMYQATHAPNSYWHVRAKTVGYEGNAVVGRSNGVDQAVATTRYMVMTRGGKGSIETFPAKWSTTGSSQGTVLSVDDAEGMSAKGKHAAEILSKAFPNTSLQLTYKLPQPVRPTSASDNNKTN